MKKDRGVRIRCVIHGDAHGCGPKDAPRCLRCEKRHAEARRTGRDIRELLRADLERRKG